MFWNLALHIMLSLGSASHRIMMFQQCRTDYFHNTVSCILEKVGVTSTNGDLKGFIDQNQSPTKGKRILLAYVVEKHTLRFISLLCLLNEYCC